MDFLKEDANIIQNFQTTEKPQKSMDRHESPDWSSNAEKNLTALQTIKAVAEEDTEMKFLDEDAEIIRNFRTSKKPQFSVNRHESPNRNTNAGGSNTVFRTIKAMTEEDMEMEFLDEDAEIVKIFKIQRRA